MSETLYCDKCGQLNRIKAEFCGHCGEKIEVLPKRDYIFFPTKLSLIVFSIFFFIFPFLFIFPLITLRVEGANESALIPYFLFLELIHSVPSMIARKRRHHQMHSITLLNFFTGWTVIGWIISLIWSASAVKK